MPNEPERPIEKLLRACGRKRREDASPAFELHPATRRLLQGEVARRFPQRAQGRSQTPRRWSAAFWPRLVEACVLVTLVTVVVSLFLPVKRRAKDQSLLARNEALTSPAPAQPSSPAPVLAPPAVAADERSKALALRDRQAAAEPMGTQKEAPLTLSPANRRAEEMQNPSALLDGTKSTGQIAPAVALAERGLKQPSAPASAPAAPAEAPALADNGLSLAKAENKPAGNPSNLFADGDQQLNATRRAPAATFGAATAAAPKDWGAATNALAITSPAGVQALAGATFNFKLKNAGDVVSADQGIVQQRFTQLPLAPTAKKTFERMGGPAVLTSFEVQQSGPTMLVIDNDGSVYTGAVQVVDLPQQTGPTDKVPSPKMAKGPSIGLQSGFAKSQLPAVQAPQFFFRVAGTNLSLKQPVVFSGNLTVLTNGVATDKLQGGVSGGEVNGQVGQGSLLNSRISGQAVIGKSKVVPINAVPTP